MIVVVVLPDPFRGIGRGSTVSRYVRALFATRVGIEPKLRSQNARWSIQVWHACKLYYVPWSIGPCSGDRPLLKMVLLESNNVAKNKAPFYEAMIVWPSIISSHVATRCILG